VILTMQVHYIKVLVYENKGSRVVLLSSKIINIDFKTASMKSFLIMSRDKHQVLTNNNLFWKQIYAKEISCPYNKYQIFLL